MVQIYSNSNINKSANQLTRPECVSFLQDLAVSSSGSLEQLRNKVIKFRRFPKLVDRLRKKAKLNYAFATSLSPSAIPPATAKWIVNPKLLPRVDLATIHLYCSTKKEGNIGQLQKAVRMLQSRRIVSVKVLVDDNKLFLKALVKKSFASNPLQHRPAIVMFSDGVPIKSHCTCAIGVSGLCCHVISVLLFCKSYYDTGEQILQLSCTQQLQKWHRRSKRGSIPMIPLQDLKAVSAKAKKSLDKHVLTAADPTPTVAHKRNVSEIRDKLSRAMDSIKPVEEHVYQVLQNNPLPKESSLHQHLKYRYHLKSALALADHDYSRVKLYDASIIAEDPDKLNAIYKFADPSLLRKNTVLCDAVTSSSSATPSLDTVMR